MGILDRRAYLQVGGRSAYIPLPDAGISMSPVSWGTTTQLVNGSNGVVASEYSARTYSLSWTILRKPDYLSISDLLSNAGSQSVLYLDKFLGVGTNMLSPLAGKPYLLAESMSPLSYDNNGVRLSGPGTGSNPPFRPLVFQAKTASDSLVHSYSETVVVPRGYSVLVVASGTNTEAAVTFNGVALASRVPTVASAPSNTDKRFDLVIKHPGTAASLDYVKAVLFPTGTTQPTDLDYAPPEGVGVLRVVPGSLSVTGLSATTGLYSMTCDVQEVWPWL